MIITSEHTIVAHEYTVSVCECTTVVIPYELTTVVTAYQLITVMAWHTTMSTPPS